MFNMSINPGDEPYAYASYSLAGLTALQLLGHVWLSVNYEKRDQKGRWNVFNAFNIQLFLMEATLIVMYVSNSIDSFYQLDPETLLVVTCVYEVAAAIFEICYIQYTWTRCTGAFELVLPSLLYFFNVLCRYIVPLSRILQATFNCVAFWFGNYGTSSQTSFWDWMFYFDFSVSMLSTGIDIVMGSVFAMYIRNSKNHITGQIDQQIFIISIFGAAASAAYFISTVIYAIYCFVDWIPLSFFLYVLVAKSVVLLILEAMKWKLYLLKSNASGKTTTDKTRTMLRRA